jgi:hypothetical protein
MVGKDRDSLGWGCGFKDHFSLVISKNILDFKSIKWNMCTIHISYFNCILLLINTQANLY